MIEISEEDGWTSEYRGLWGLDTWDPLGGERAPSGPKYDRDGSIRLSWSNPLAWAGLDKVPPPKQATADMEHLLVDFETRGSVLRTQLEGQREKVRKLELEVGALRQTAFLTTLYKHRLAELAAAENELRTLGVTYNDLIESQEACKAQLARMQAGDFGGPRDHIQHAHSPQPPITSSGRFIYWWAAVSGGVILLLILPILYIHPASWPFWLFGIFLIFGAIDSATRGQSSTFLLRLTLFFAILTSLILLFHFWWLVLILGLTLVVIVGIRDNIRELAGG